MKTRNDLVNKKSPAGRNPSIDRAKIEAAVAKVAATGEVSVNKVAAELGVNVTTVYRHTGGLDGLLRISALLQFASLGAAPAHAGLSWQLWLAELAQFYRAAMLRNPTLLRYAQAALDPRFYRLEQATKVLLEYGFSLREAVRAHAFLVNNVVGYVHQELQTEEEKLRGSTPVYEKLAHALRADAEHLPTLTQLRLNNDDLDSETNFAYFMRYAIDGIKMHHAQEK